MCVGALVPTHTVEYSVDLAALRNKSVTIRIDFDGELLTITYNPHMYDDDCQRILNDLTNQPDNTGLAGIFERLLTSWDLKDSGVQVPCTYESFTMLPPFLRTKILNAVIEDEMERGKLRSSDNGSNQAVTRRSALVPIGSSASATSNGQE